MDSYSLVFDVESLEGRIIKEDADYEGVRVTFLALLQNARIHMQVDTCFGDVVVPSAHLMEYPTILDDPPPRLYGYSRETTVAEKFEALVKLGQLNSRIRDFFDIWLLSLRVDIRWCATSSGGVSIAVRDQDWLGWESFYFVCIVLAEY